MSTAEASFQSRRPQRLVVAAALAVLGIGAVFYGTRSGQALAEPESTTRPNVTTSMTPQSVPAHTADPDADFGPGQCEPCVVGLQ